MLMPGENFFSTIQLLFAGNDTQGLHYGTVTTHEKFFVQWKLFLVGGLAFDSTGESCYLTRVATGKFISFP